MHIDLWLEQLNLNAHWCWLRFVVTRHRHVFALRYFVTQIESRCNPSILPFAWCCCWCLTSFSFLLCPQTRWTFIDHSTPLLQHHLQTCVDTREMKRHSQITCSRHNPVLHLLHLNGSQNVRFEMDAVGALHEWGSPFLAADATSAGRGAAATIRIVGQGLS